MAKRVGELRGQCRQHRPMRTALQDGIPQGQNAHIPFARDLAQGLGDGQVVVLHLIGGIDQQQPPARGGRGQRQRHLKSVAFLDVCAEIAEIGLQGRVFLRVQFGQMDRVGFAQTQGRDHRRAGIGARSKHGAAFGQPLDVRVIGGKPTFGEIDARLRLAGFQRLVRSQIIKPPPGMGFDIAERFVLLGQVLQHPRQKCVLLHIGQISGVIDVLIGKHTLPR